jgi:hypothetical protein
MAFGGGDHEIGVWDIPHGQELVIPFHLSGPLATSVTAWHLSDPGAVTCSSTFISYIAETWFWTFLGPSMRSCTAVFLLSVLLWEAMEERPIPVGTHGGSLQEGTRKV